MATSIFDDIGRWRADYRETTGRWPTRVTLSHGAWIRFLLASDMQVTTTIDGMTVQVDHKATVDIVCDEPVSVQATLPTAPKVGTLTGTLHVDDEQWHAAVERITSAMQAQIDAAILTGDVKTALAAVDRRRSNHPPIVGATSRRIILPDDD